MVYFVSIWAIVALMMLLFYKRNNYLKESGYSKWSLIYGAIIWPLWFGIILIIWLTITLFPPKGSDSE